MMKRISDTDTLDQLEQLLIQSGAEYRRAPASLDTASAPVEIASQIESLPSGEVFIVRQGPAFIANRIVETDRKSVVEGKSVSVRVDLGGRRIIKKKNKNH